MQRELVLCEFTAEVVEGDVCPVHDGTTCLLRFQRVDDRREEIAAEDRVIIAAIKASRSAPVSGFRPLDELDDAVDDLCAIRSAALKHEKVSAESLRVAVHGEGPRVDTGGFLTDEPSLGAGAINVTIGSLRPAYSRVMALIAVLEAEHAPRIIHGALKAALIAEANSFDAIRVRATATGIEVEVTTPYVAGNTTISVGRVDDNKGGK